MEIELEKLNNKFLAEYLDRHFSTNISTKVGDRESAYNLRLLSTKFFFFFFTYCLFSLLLMHKTERIIQDTFITIAFI